MVKFNMKKLLKLGYVNLFLLSKIIGMTLLVFFGTLGGVHYFNQMLGLSDDNELEQQIENMIENQTGIDIDLTPGDC